MSEGVHVAVCGVYVVKPDTRERSSIGPALVALGMKRSTESDRSEETDGRAGGRRMSFI